MQQYLDLISTVLYDGVTKTDRTGTGTKGIFGYETRFDLREGFPLVTVKKTNFDAIAHELLWFIKGDTNIRYLVQNGVNIWNEWPYKRYVAAITSPFNSTEANPNPQPLSFTDFVTAIREDARFAEEWGQLGPVYGAQWRNWGGQYGIGIDQLADVVKTIRTSPDSRRLIVSAWNPAELHLMALPPCHAFFQFNCEPLTLSERWKIANNQVRQFNLIGLRELPAEEQHLQFNACGIPQHYLSLKLTQRSADIMLGVPFNIASYALLLEMVAKVTNTVAKELIYSLGDAHIYSNHISAAETLLESSKIYPLPTLELGSPGVSIHEIDGFRFEDINLLNYQHGPFVKLPVAV
jgi:thymidylate synthase